MATRAKVSLAPRSVGERELQALRKELAVLQRALVETEPNGTDSDLARDQLSLVTRMVASYRREVQLALHGLQLGGSRKFDNHDQFASLLLFLRLRFQRLRTPTGTYSLQHFMKVARHHWHEANPVAAGDYTLSFDRNELADQRRPKIGILTVLEHEYQSVLRRLDDISLCSDDSAHGFAILDRLGPADDLKSTSSEEEPLRKAGWTDGLLAGERVLVICTGDSGKERARAAITAVQDILPGTTIPEIGWLVVGVCGGTAKDWPVGTILISSGVVAGVNRKHSNKYMRSHLKTIKPMELPRSSETLRAEGLYRRVPQDLPNGIRVADPRSLPIHKVKFACTPHVVNDLNDQQELRNFLIREKVLESGEEFGIEMEGVGAEFSQGERMSIVKAVCDYADISKGGEWPNETKQILQLYAAETAAETAIRIARRLVKTTREAEPNLAELRIA